VIFSVNKSEGNYMSNAPLYVIVQAGGRGSRLRHHTWNKPKCLVSFRGKPILYHLFDHFDNANYVIIGDYGFDKLEKYLLVNPPKVNYRLIQTNNKGTSAGISDAINTIPDNAQIVLTWSDLIINDLPPWPTDNKLVVCTTSSFTCRWTVSPNGRLEESPNGKQGIPGIFYFPSKFVLQTLPPSSGEFVKWLSQNLTDYAFLDCNNLEELGDFSTIENNLSREGLCRFFNSVEINNKYVIKKVLDKDYEHIHHNEILWYEEAIRLGFKRIPKIYGTLPLTMSRIQGQHAFQINDLSDREQRALLVDYLESLITLHDKSSISSSQEEVEEVYINKTISRVQSVSSLIPGFERESITINGKKCRNFFNLKHFDNFKTEIKKLQPTRFVPIHGDPTFSNTLIDDNLRVWFFDPRGYFAKPGIYGDGWYDFAKVYYSAVGGYDLFNRRNFKLHVDDDTIEILTPEPSFAKAAKVIFNNYFNLDLPKIETLHGLIWLSLSGYVKDDIDSIIGSFYLGLYWTEIGLERL